MLRFYILFLLVVCRCVRGGVLDSKESVNHCVTVSFSEEAFKLLRKTSSNLKTFLDEGAQSLQTVLTSSDVDVDPTLKVDPEASFESFLPQHYTMLHRDMERISSQMETLFQQLTSLTSFLNLNKKSLVSNPKLNPEAAKKTDKEKTNFRPSDCSEILVAGEKKSGVYQIYPFRCRCSPPVNVFCDMETDGGGWTVFLSRMNHSKPVNFTRNWEDYKNGFGNPETEYWLGNEILHILTTVRNYVLRMEANDGFGREIWGECGTFRVDSEDVKYKLTAQDYNTKSTASSELFSYHNGMQFTTFDQDHDTRSKENCAELWKGGWWYNDCSKLRPTGEYGAKGDNGIRLKPWSKMDSKKQHADWIQLKIRPKICNNLIQAVRTNTQNCAFP